MTTTALKALIEPTQDGARFSHGLIHSDSLTAYIEGAIDTAEDISDLSEKLDYAVEQLNRAREVIAELDLDEKIGEEDADSGGDKV